MTITKAITALGAAAVLFAAAVGPAAAGENEQKEEGWIKLFNGENLSGWKQINGKATYEVKDGTILGTSVPNSPNSFLCTEERFSDFELVFDVKVDAALNSGVQIRSNATPDYKNNRVHGYQVEIAVGAWSGCIYDEARRGRFLNPDEQMRDEVRKLLKADQWNHYRVICCGDRIMTWVNGEKVTDLRDDMTRSGFIGLQVHGVGGRTDPLRVQWKNIRLRKLSADNCPEE